MGWFSRKKKQAAAPAAVPASAVPATAPVPAAPPAAPAPPVDLDKPVASSKPVANSKLVAQMIRGARSGTPQDMVRTMQMQREAVYLLGTQVSHPDGGTPVVDGVMRAGTQITVYSVLLPDDRQALAVFTDGPSLRAAVGDGPGWSSMVQPGEEVFKLALTSPYAGVVINPAGPQVSFPLDHEKIALLYRHTQPPKKTVPQPPP